jgi:NAD(P)-dependent dehydrogenase (short-subunit alcohol dehydrogenase family)
MRTIAITGSASGIGAATRKRLERDGARVVGVDLRGAEVEADLGTSEGRAAAVAALDAAASGTLDGVVACAGLGPQHPDRAAIVSVNYFGAIEVLDGLLPLLVRGEHAAAVAICSNSATLSPSVDGPIAAACLAPDEAEARRLARDSDGATIYGASKLALGRSLRRRAASPSWAGAKIRLNGVAPGPVLTPLLQGGLDDPVLGGAIRGLPVPLGGFGAPEQIAAAVAFLLGPEAAFCCGSILFVDGGTDALFSPDRL